MRSSRPSFRSRGDGRRRPPIRENRPTSRRSDMKSWTIAIVAAITAGMLASTARAEVFVYPKPGQSQDAFQKDQYECHNWAKQQTGFDPAQPPQAAAAPPPQQGGAVKGAAKGAAVGAVGGAIGGDAGKGAAVGAGAGATAGARGRFQRRLSVSQLLLDGPPREQGRSLGQ